jgi:threonine dehydrogenase-like Zn-dependent dehydrogenase
MPVISTTPDEVETWMTAPAVDVWRGDHRFRRHRRDHIEKLKEMTGGRGPDKCIDAVGAESHATASFDAVLDKAKAAVLLGTDRPHVLRAALMACRPGGIVSVPGVYGGFLDKVPFGAAMNKGLTIRTGQTHVNRYDLDLLRRIEEGQIDPSYIITHRAKLPDGPGLYETFRDKKDGCIKVVLTP